MAKLPAKTGQDNPASSQRTDVISNRQSMPESQMPGDRTRKVSGPKKVGQDVAGDANQVKITFGGSDAGKQTWKGAREGYTTKSIPDYKPSPASDTYQDTKPLSTGSKPTAKGEYTGKRVSLNGSLTPYKDGPKQSVKGKHPARTDGEAKSVAGQTSITSY